MRPQLLAIDGFGAFRDRVELDFTGIDFFALVGPTGSGKSTVIDAICFALYGSVPRYNDERLVAPIISTGAAEARVSLTFSAGGSTYTATRVARRTPKGATTKEARLERQAEDGAVQTLAASAGEVTTQVQSLLGLSFAHFTRCVVLPQGEFAKFLHDKPSDRQEVLVKLLELDVYRKMMQAANTRASTASAEQLAIAAVITELGDLSDDALAEAARKHEALQELRDFLDQANGVITDILGRGTAAADENKKIREHTNLLSALVVPTAVGDLASRMAAGSAALADAEARLVEAHAKVEAAAAEVAALPSPDALDTALRDHHDLSMVTAQLGEVGGRLADAAAALESAARDVEATGQQIVSTRNSLEPLHELEAAVSAHADLGALRSRLAENATASEQATAALLVLSERRTQREADVVAFTAVASRAASLSRLVETHAEYAAKSQELHDARQQADEGEAGAARLGADARAASEAARKAQEAMASIERSNAAAAIALTLKVGDECPVCHHEVTAVSGHSSVPELHVARAALNQAAADEAAAGQAHDTAVRAAQKLRSAAGAIEARCAELAAELNALADAALDPVLAGDAAAADAALVAAIAAQHDLAETTAELSGLAKEQARIELKLAELRTEAKGWAAQEAGLDETVGRYPDLSGLRERVGRARLAQAGLERLEAALLAARRTEAACATDRAALAATAEHLASQQAALQARCANHLSNNLSMSEAVAKREALNVAIGSHAGAVTQAKAAAELCARIKSGMKELVAAESSARTQFQSARDSVAALAPPVAADVAVAELWNELVAWAVVKRTELESRQAELETLLTELRSAIGTKRRERADRVARVLEAEVAPDTPDVDLDRQITAAIGTARAEITRIGKGRERTAELRADEMALQGRAEVARKLGQLLSAKQFEQWLVATALKSLTAAASDILERLSGHEFGLEATDGNDFLVIDHHNADERRPVRSLSGGETFQASLALALALSQELGGLTAQPGRSLDSIFLDEGFGTLDPETLETVAGTIESLGSDGRMVGIITHVRELAERVPVRFRVTKGERTSTIGMEGM